MKCKKGDIARIISSTNGINNHRLVRCEFVDDIIDGKVTWGVTTMQTIYNFDTKRDDPPGSHGICADELLEPLPGLGDDEFDQDEAPINKDVVKTIEHA